MKISIQELWHNCKIHLEANIFESKGTSIDWLSQITPLRRYLDQQSQYQEVIQINLPDSNKQENISTTIPFPNELVSKDAVNFSQKKLKKLQRLSKVLYQVNEENNIQPTSLVQSYFQHKTFSDKARLDSKIQNIQSVSYTNPIDQEAQNTFKNWCENGFKYEYEQILYFFNQIGTLIPANLSDYFPIATGFPKRNFKCNTYLPFPQINTAEIWSSIQLPYQIATKTKDKNKAQVQQFSFDFAQIPIVTSYFPSSNKNSSSDTSNLLSKSILLLRNVLFQGRAVLLEESPNLGEPIVVGFKYEKIVN